MRLPKFVEVAIRKIVEDAIQEAVEALRKEIDKLLGPKDGQGGV